MVQVALLVKAPMAHEEGNSLSSTSFHGVNELVYWRTAECPLGESQIDQIIGRQIGGGELDGYPPVGEERAGKPSPITVWGMGFDGADGSLRVQLHLRGDGLGKGADRRGQGKVDNENVRRRNHF